MVAMAQRLDARSLFFCPQLSVAIFLALVLKVFRNRFRCHSQSVAELCPSKLSNFGHFVTIHGRICQPFPNPGAAEPEQSTARRFTPGPPGIGTLLLSLKLNFGGRSIS
jgi:hypothetical protein